MNIDTLFTVRSTKYTALWVGTAYFPALGQVNSLSAAFSLGVISVQPAGMLN